MDPHNLLIASIHIWTCITDSNIKRRNSNSFVRVPWERDSTMASRHDKLVGDNKRIELLPNIRHAYVWWLRVQLHNQVQEAMPVVAPRHPSSYLWLFLLLHSRGNALCREFCRSNWWDFIACHIGLPLFHVAQDQEAQGLRRSLVAQLVSGNLGNLLECITGCC